MRRHRDACIALLGLAIAGAATARDQGFDVFLQRHALEGTRLQWQIDRLRNGNPAARVQAAREIAADPAMLASTSALLATERQAVLRDIVAQLPAGDRAAARPRLEMARQQLAEGAVLVESMRGTERDATAAKTAMEALSQAGELLRPLLTSDSSRMDRQDPLAGVHEGADLLDAWRRTLQAWVALHGGGASSDAAAAKLELERAIVLFARLVDADAQSPEPGNASADLLRTEMGADAALGLAAALHAAGRDAAGDAWLQAVAGEASATTAAGRVALWRLAFAIDRQDLHAMREVLDHMPPRTLTPGLARSAARVASRDAGADATAVVTAAMDAMDADARKAWLAQLASQSGPLRALASALQKAEAQLPAWQRREGAPADAAAVAAALRDGLAKAGDAAPAPMRAEALRALGYALVASGDAAAASVAFEQAAAVRPSLRPECLWLAAAHEPAKDAAAQRRRIDLLLRQRESDPLGPYAGRVATWLSQLDGFPSDAVATAVLLEVPDRDALFAAARAEAARRILRGGAEDAAAQTRSAERALRVTDACVASPLVARWRLLAATTPGAQDRLSAEQALQVLAATERLDAATLLAIVRLQVMQGDMSALQATLAQAPAALRARLALAAAFALSDMQAADRLQAAVACARLAADEAGEDAALAAAARDRLARSVLAAADAEVVIDAGMCARLIETLQRAPSTSITETFALAEALRMAGRGAEAAERMQVLSGTLAQGTEPWLEARWRLYRALQSFDAARAASMLQQHMTLLPEGGAQPWGALFRDAAQTAPRTGAP